MQRQLSLIALFGGAIMCIASPVWAGSERDVGPRGYQVQTWQDIERAREDIQRQVGALEHKSGAGTSFGYTRSRYEHRGPRR
jgi:hypothetical protein